MRLLLSHLGVEDSGKSYREDQGGQVIGRCLESLLPSKEHPAIRKFGNSVRMGHSVILLGWGCKVLMLANSRMQFTSLMSESCVARASTCILEPVLLASVWTRQCFAKMRSGQS